MPLTSKITPYNPQWPVQYEVGQSLLASAFAAQLQAMEPLYSCK